MHFINVFYYVLLRCASVGFVCRWSVVYSWSSADGILNDYLNREPIYSGTLLNIFSKALYLITNNKICRSLASILWLISATWL